MNYFIWTGNSDCLYEYTFRRVLTQKAKTRVDGCFTHLLVTHYTVALHFPPHIGSGLSFLDTEGMSVSVIKNTIF